MCEIYIYISIYIYVYNLCIHRTELGIVGGLAQRSGTGPLPTKEAPMTLPDHPG